MSFNKGAAVDGHDDALYKKNGDELAASIPEQVSHTTAKNKMDSNNTDDEFHPGPRFWAIILRLSVALLLTALENTVVTVAAPSIISDLDVGENYIWITNAFFICSAAVQPLIGQLCNVFGRRWNSLTSVAMFTLGSGICGGAKNTGMLIAGRAIQGLGSGGIILLNDIVLSDLVPLRQRGNYIGIILVIYGIGTTLGPFIGGSIVGVTTWRWIFYLNLPIGGIAFILLFFSLQVKYDKETSLAQKLRRIDFVGNGVLMASATSILYALAYAGARYSWGDWHVLLPLLLGFLGLAIFVTTQTGRFAAAEPVMPLRLFGERTSVIIAINTLINSALTFWGVFFLPVYFQAVQLFGTQRTGVALLPMSLVAIPGAALAAVAISRRGRYKPVHVAGFAIFMLGLGLFALQNEDTTVAQLASYQCVAALGGGILLNSQLPAFQNGVSEADQAAASAAWGFIRSIGWIWGVAIPATIFNNRVDQLIHEVSDVAAADLMAGGGAFGAASAAQVKQFPLPVQAEMRSVYARAVQRVFQISVAFAGLAFALSLAERELALRETLKTEFGLTREDKEKGKAEATAQVG